MDEDVIKWRKRLLRKGPFYLLETTDFEQDRYDHSVKPTRHYTVPAKAYTVIWNDGDKTKIGVLKDYMYCRYGIITQSVLKGDTPFDLWNGSGLSQETFDEMLSVRHNRSTLAIFDFDLLVGLGH